MGTELKYLIVFSWCVEVITGVEIKMCVCMCVWVEVNSVISNCLSNCLLILITAQYKHGN